MDSANFIWGTVLIVLWVIFILIIRDKFFK